MDLKPDLKPDLKLDIDAKWLETRKAVIEQDKLLAELIKPVLYALLEKISQRIRANHTWTACSLEGVLPSDLEYGSDILDVLMHRVRDWFIERGFKAKNLDDFYIHIDWEDTRGI